MTHSSTVRENYIASVPKGYIYVRGVSDDGGKLRYSTGVSASASVTDATITYATCSASSGSITWDEKNFLTT